MLDALGYVVEVLFLMLSYSYTVVPVETLYLFPCGKSFHCFTSCVCLQIPHKALA